MDNGAKEPRVIIAPEEGPATHADGKYARHRKLAERLSQYEGVPESSDFTISGIDCEYNVHSRIICARSRFFDRAVNGRFAESTSKRIHLPEEDAESLELLISILYGFESSYSAELWPEAHEDIKRLLVGIDQPNSHIVTSSSSTIEMGSCSKPPPHNSGLGLLRLYALVDQFDIFWLQAWAKEIVLLWARANVRRDNFVEVVQEVYQRETGNYSDLVGGISAIIIDNVDVLIENDDFYEVVAENGELGAELLRHVILTNRVVHSALEMRSSLAKLQNIGGNKLVYERAKLQLRIHHSLAEFPGLVKRR
ncbi:hypothetical protein AJ78_01487 [Emergomyces pasteurianus Ep9510]|uniref:BTB domain-containing protein n=1 Tax=Emergomyces pasteurianus Ep9510 TaxID=1447872 RepID=A0A1J9PRF7_9EURO|nr:hypothetical protein AJ78_01487 [Emergomyces pasteurianus Ep9510]